MNNSSSSSSSRDRGFRLFSSSTTSMTSNSEALVLPIQERSSSSSNSSQILPWAVLGFSMGVGYFGVESLLAYYHWHYNRNSSSSENNGEKRRKHPLHAQVVNQLEQLKQTLSFSNVQTSLLRWWTVPFLWQDIMWGVFFTVLPTSGAENPVAARILNRPVKKSETQSQQQQPPASAEKVQLKEGDAFLTLPPQLQPRLPPKAPVKNAPKKERYLEMLLHNVSHTDLVLGFDVIDSHRLMKETVQNKNSSSNNKTDLKTICLCRPRFSAFDMYCRKLLQALQEEREAITGTSNKKNDTNGNNKNNKNRSKDEAEIILVPQYQRSQSDPRYTIQPSDRPHVSTGFYWNTSDPQQRLSEESNSRVFPLIQALADLRVRGKDMAKLDPYVKPNSSVTTTTSPRVYQKFDDKDDDRSSSPTVSTWNMVSIAGHHHDTAAATEQTPPPKSRNREEDILVELKAIFFPLLATLLPRWHEQIAHKYSEWRKEHVVEKVLVLVTGVGTPRNWTHSITGNSTQALADLMELFLAKVYPDITVVKIHSDTNIFRYDDNILFVQQQLLPCVNAYRDAHATQAPYPHEIAARTSSTSSNTSKQRSNSVGFEQQLQPQAQQAQNAFDVDWKRSFAVTLSFADGSPARTHAIQTALRIFRPTYFHIWQLKTFWHERKIVDDDVEEHSFEEMETSPALESSLLRGELAQVVQEMKAFRHDMTQSLLKADENDLHSFWLRKTHKPVLAVLLVQSEGQPPVLYRGTNMEVSMPTGSLCAERNVIGTALASNPQLKRQDLKCIAVLAVPPPPSSSSASSKQRSASHGNASDICGSCKSSRHSSFDDTCPTSTMTGHQIRHHSFDEKEEEDWMLGDTGVTTITTEQEDQMQSHGAPIRQISLFSSNSSNSLVDMIKTHPTVPTSPHTSKRNKKSAPSSPATSIQEKRTVIVRSNNRDVDLNPLRPCGACHEWLKKIAECNPYFQIMTFTDADCNGVYVTPCQE